MRSLAACLFGFLFAVVVAVTTIHVIVAPAIAKATASFAAINQEPAPRRTSPPARSSTRIAQCSA
jgi:hypothetical protein